MISVVVPCFNAASYIGEALQSALTQSLPVDEIIVVDDGSTDGSAAIARSMGPRVSVLEQTNQGAAAARNTGVNASRGDRIAFLDADDVWVPDAIANLVRVLAPQGANSHDEKLGAAAGAVESFLSTDLDPVIARQRQLPPTREARMAGALLIRRRCFEVVGPFDAALRMGEFMDWFSRFDAHGFTVATCGNVVVRRRIHANNTVYLREQTHANYLASLRQNIARRRSGTLP